MANVDVLPVLGGAAVTLLGLVLLYAGARDTLAWYRIRTTTPATVAGADDGPVELEGTAGPHHRETVAPPIADAETLAYEYELERFRDEENKWKTVDRGTVAVPFRVDDGTGSAVVDPEGAGWFLGDATTEEFRPADGLSTQLASFLRSERPTGESVDVEYDPADDRWYRLSVGRLDAGDEVYVSGAAVQTHEAAVTPGDADRAVIDTAGSWLSVSHPFVVADGDETTAAGRIRDLAVGRFVIGLLVSAIGAAVLYGTF